MTSLNPRLHLKRLIIASKGHVAYDQVFYSGVNIIRGDNAHGKSTIADFIFYVLGGDHSLWKDEALLCDTVTAEVMLNGVNVVLRRYVSVEMRQPLQVYWGSLEDAMASKVSGWEIYPYSRSANKESFSQKIFHALDLPQVRGMEGEAITLHQLLRLIYVDQISPYDSLLRVEPFDSSLKREAIGDLMLGVYERVVHDDQIELQKKTRELDIARADIRSLEHVFKELEIKVDAREIEKERTQMEVVLSRIDSEIAEISGSDSPEIRLSQIDEPLVTRLIELRKRHSAGLEKLQAVRFDIEDSKLFIRDIELKIQALHDSISTRKGMGAISLEFCPVCLAPINELKDSVSRCCLCNSETKPDALDARALRMLSELEMQKNESTELLDAKVAQSRVFTRELANLEAEMDVAQKERDNALGSARSSRDAKLDALLKEHGAAAERLKSLNQGVRSAAILRDFEQREKELQQAIDRLKHAIQENKKKQAARLETVSKLISELSVRILNQDSVEQRFATAEHVVVDWKRNTFSVDGKNNFSASSVVFARNAVHFAILFASLKLGFMRYPRFILCDCMEDKGMIPSRSGRFQQAVVEMSKAATVEHQIIFTTSMIEPTLDGEEYCRGPNYRGGVRTLDLPDQSMPSYRQATAL